jgi:hypothetical protein
MSLLEWTRHPVQQLTKYTDLGVICLQDVSRFEECDQVWGIVGIALAIVCILVLGFIARHFYREYAGYRRVRRQRLAEMEVASPEVMGGYVWSGEKALETGLSQEEMIQRIKEAQAQKRATSADKPAGDPTLGIGKHPR